MLGFLANEVTLSRPGRPDNADALSMRKPIANHVAPPAADLDLCIPPDGQPRSLQLFDKRTNSIAIVVGIAHENVNIIRIHHMFAPLPLSTSIRVPRRGVGADDTGQGINARLVSKEDRLLLCRRPFL